MFRMRTGRLILASASPRRRDLLERMGLDPEIIVSGVDEEALAALPGDRMARELSLLKARAVADLHPERWVIAGDTVVVCEGRSFGKPKDDAEAMWMLGELAKAPHQVIGGIALVNKSRNIEESAVASTDVEFSAAPVEQLAAYIRTGEPFDKAGAYGMQERGGAFVRKISGSPTNVIGLDIPTVIELLLSHDVIEADR